MQREITALLRAYLEDKQRETKLVQDFLSALAVNAAGREKMLEDLAKAVIAITGLPPVSKGSPAKLEDDLTHAVDQLRTTNAFPASH